MLSDFLTFRLVLMKGYDVYLVRASWEPVKETAPSLVTCHPVKSGAGVRSACICSPLSTVPRLLEQAVWVKCALDNPPPHSHSLVTLLDVLVGSGKGMSMMGGAV